MYPKYHRYSHTNKEAIKTSKSKTSNLKQNLNVEQTKEAVYNAQSALDLQSTEIIPEHARNTSHQSFMNVYYNYKINIAHLDSQTRSVHKNIDFPSRE